MFNNGTNELANGALQGQIHKESFNEFEKRVLQTLYLQFINNTGLRLKTFFKRSKVFYLILEFFSALSPNILSIFFGQVKFLRYN